MTGSLQRELAPIVEILETTEDIYTQRLRNVQQEEFTDDSIVDLDMPPPLPQDWQQSLPQKKSMQPDNHDTPVQLLTLGASPSPTIASTPAPEIHTPEADSDGAASEGVEPGREEKDCEEVSQDRSPPEGLSGAAEKVIPKPRRARHDGISAENLITGSRTQRPTAKGEEYLETRKGKYSYEVLQNLSNFAYLAAFHTGLKHRLHRKNMLPEPKS
jgi:hypothetical protein